MNRTYTRYWTRIISRQIWYFFRTKKPSCVTARGVPPAAFPWHTLSGRGGVWGRGCGIPVQVLPGGRADTLSKSCPEEVPLSWSWSAGQVVGAYSVLRLSGVPSHPPPGQDQDRGIPCPHPLVNKLKTLPSLVLCTGAVKRFRRFKKAVNLFFGTTDSAQYPTVRNKNQFLWSVTFFRHHVPDSNQRAIYVKYR